MHIERVELVSQFSVVVENNISKKETVLGINNWSMEFYSKQSVLDHIALLYKALDFWEYDKDNSTAQSTEPLK